MNDKNNIIKTTCNNFPQEAIIPIPARVVAEISNVSESYVKKLRGGDREDHSEKAQKVLNADTLLSEGMQVLVNEVKQVINK